MNSDERYNWRKDVFQMEEHLHIHINSVRGRVARVHYEISCNFHLFKDDAMFVTAYI